MKKLILCLLFIFSCFPVFSENILWGRWRIEILAVKETIYWDVSDDSVIIGSINGKTADIPYTYDPALSELTINADSAPLVLRCERNREGIDFFLTILENSPFLLLLTV